MLRSMTGYGRGETDSSVGRWVVEMKSVNHRYLDVKAKLPPELFALDIEFTRIIQERASRGRFEVLLSRESGATQGGGINRQAVVQYLEELRSLRQELDIEGAVTLDTLLMLPDVVQENRRSVNDADQKAILKALTVALENLDVMRLKEGASIYADIHIRVTNILNDAAQIEAQAPRLTQALRDKLAGRLKDLAGTVNVDSQRVEQELAILAEKSDVTEELVRLGIHGRQFLLFLDEKTAVGRKMDFLLQEMNREVNTLGSKIADAEVAQRVVHLKSELEKIREQIQNVE